LGANIKRETSLLDRAKNLIGRKSPIRHNPREVRIAKLMAQSKHDRTEKNKKRHEEEIAQRYKDEQLKEERRLAQIRFAQQEARDRMESEKQIKAAKERAKFPRNPITQADIAAARRNYEDLRVAAQGSATTDRFVSPAYDVLGKNRDAARERWEKLKEKFAEQESKTPGAQFVPPVTFRQGSVFGIPPRPGARGPEGGKSKRVKSKRNKRSTKRRNARK
jgi:hypothetical protein